jgi:CNT family concentrative nucleoside transporter
MSLLQLQSGFGLLLLCALAWALGGFRRGVRPRVVIAGLGSMLAVAAALLHVPVLRAVAPWLAALRACSCRCLKRGMQQS